MITSADQKRWQAEDDAHTLARAQIIQADKARLSAAKEAAARMAEEQRKEAAAMSNVARRSARTAKSSKGSDDLNVFKRLDKK